MMRCKPGDLAVVIDAANKTNIGRIVKVVAQHDGKGPLCAIGPKPVWLVECPNTMLLTDGPKRYRRKSGPVPDLQLHPIRGAELPIKRARNKGRKKQKELRVAQ